MAKNDVQIKFSVFNQDYNKAVREMSEETSLLTKQYKLEQEQLKQIGTESEKLQSTLNYLSKTYEIASNKVKETEAQLEKAKLTFGENSDEVKKLEGMLLTAQTAEQRLANQIADTTQKLRLEENQLNKLGKELDETGKKLKDFGDKSKDAGENLTKGLTVPLVAIGTAGVVASENIDSALAKIDNRLGAQGELEFYKEALEEIGSTGVGSFNEVSEAIVLVEQNMKDVSDEAFNVVIEQAIHLANVMGKDVQEVTRASGTLMKQFGVDGETALDLITVGMQNGLDYSGELLDTINEYSVQFQALGFNAEGFFNALIAGAEAGAFNLDKVGDAVKEFNIRAKDGSDNTNKAFESLGFNADELGRKFAQGGQTAQESFVQVVQALQGVTDEQKKNEIGIALFGSMYEDLEADVVGALGTIENSLGGYGSAADDVASKNQTLGQILSGAWNDLQVALAPVGTILKDMLLNVLPPLLDVLKGMSEWFAGLSPEIQTVIITLGGLLAAIGPLLFIIGTLAGSLGNILTLFGGFATAAGTASVVAGATGTATAGLGATIAGLIGPIAAIIAAIVGFIAIIVKLYKDNEEFRNLVNAVWTEIKNTISSVISAVVSFVKSLFGDLVVWWQENQETIMQAASIVWKAIQTVIMTILNVLGPYIKNAWNNIKFAIEIVWNAIKAVISAAMAIIQGVIATVSNIITGNWKGAWNSIKDMVINIWNSIFVFFKQIPGQMLGFGKNIIDGLINGIKSKISAVTNVVKGIANTVTGGIKKALGIHSPSRVLMELGEYTGEGFEIGIADKIQAVKDKVRELSNAAITTAQGVTANSDISNYASTNNNQFVIHATVRDDQDINSLVDEISYRLEGKRQDFELARGYK